MPPAFIHRPSVSNTDTWIQEGTKKGALVILPVHPRKPGQAWQHHSFKVSLSAPAQGHCCGHRATGTRRPGLVARGPFRSQHCPRLRADSTLKLRQERGKTDSGDEGSSPNVQAPRKEPHWMQVGLHSPDFWSFEVPTAEERSLFSFLTLGGQEGEARGMAGNSREGWVGRARCYPRCSWQGKGTRADIARPLFPQ